MAQLPRPLQPDLSLWHLLGARLRQCRVERGLSQRALGRLVHVSGDLIAKIEKGERTASLDLVRRCDAELGADGALVDLRHAVDRDHGGASPRSVDRLSIMSHLPALRRVLDAYDLPEDGELPEPDSIRGTVSRVVAMRLASQYLGLAVEIPRLLPAYLRLFHASSGRHRAEAARILIQVLRAADAIADKFALRDLSAWIIGIMSRIAEESDDEPTIATVSYVRGEGFFDSGEWWTGCRLLERAAGSLSSISSPSMAAAYGALHMRAAVLAARGRDQGRARDHIAEAATVAARTPEGIYAGTAFGPASVRIHRISAAIDAGYPDDALRIATGWVPPLTVPAERRSHFWVDVADAQAQCGKVDDAVLSLQVARRIAPQHVRHHPRVKTTLLMVSQRRSTRSMALRDLARWTGALSR